VDHKDNVPRPVHSADLLVVIIGFINNVVQSLGVFLEELLELSVYNANRTSKVNKVWEDFANDLEKIEEDQDGA
jgi:hypothetical protein